jgi:hypothetical protein
MEYDIALSFAGEDREYVEKVAAYLRRSGVKVFYDKYEQVGLWGKDLYEHLSEVYQRKARFTVMFISRYYAEKLWTQLERKNAQARAFREKVEYILPTRFDDTEIPGLTSTVGYLDLRNLSPAQLAKAICEKLTQTGVPSVPVVPSTTPESTAPLLNAAPELRELEAPPRRVNDVLKRWYAIQAANSQAFLHHLLARDNELRSQYREFCSEFIVSYLPGIAGRRYSSLDLLNHFAAIEQNIYSLLPPENRTVIKPLEAMILLLGIFCHDVGVKRCNEDSVAWPFDDHHEIGSELVCEEFQTMRIAPPLVDSVATLVRYHRALPLDDVPEKHVVQCAEVRIRFLASLLRLADFLDYRHGLISATAPNIDAISIRSLSLRINAEIWTISIEGHAESISEAKAAIGLKYNIESILSGVKKVLAQNGLMYETVGISNNLIAPLLPEND